MLGTIQKLWGRSLDELLTRSRQEVSKSLELLGFVGYKSIEAVELTPHVDRRMIFAPWLSDRSEFVSLVETRLPNERDRILRDADRIRNGRFDLLGYDGLDFGSPIPDWHLDPVSGRRSPYIHWSRINEIDASKTGDKKVIWELNRHQYFETLGQAYLLSGDEVFAETFATHLEDWFENNPPKVGINWLSSLELAFRSISWIRSYFYFEPSPLFTSELKRRMFKILSLQARHIETYLSTYFAPNTHITGEGLGLYYIGTFLNGGRMSTRWKETGYRILMVWLSRHIRPDGSYCEQASHYARYTADFYSDLILLRMREGLPIEDDLKNRLESLFSFLKAITRPDGTMPLFGDDDGGRYFASETRPIEDIRRILLLGAFLFDRGDLKYQIDSFESELLWIAGPGSSEALTDLDPEEPRSNSESFENGGFYTFRSSWEPNADHFVIICGPHGFMNGGHAHADALSFVASLAGKSVFVDSGTFVYTSDLEARDRYRTSMAHNCLTVDGFSSSRTAGPFSWKSQANARLIEWHEHDSGVRFRGSHDGFDFLEVKYERSIEIGPRGSLRIVDGVSSETRHTYEINFILAPGIVVNFEDEVVTLSGNDLDGHDVRIKTRLIGESLDSEGRWQLIDSHLSPVYGKEIPSKRLVFSFAGSGTIEFTATVTWKI